MSGAQNESTTRRRARRTSFQEEDMLSFAMVSLLAAQVGQAGAAAPSADASPQPWAKGPIVTMQTSQGTIVIGLDREKAPLTVANFLSYVRGGFYDGTIFHRVMRGFMIQGGGFDQQLMEQPTRKPVRNESKNGLSNRRGTIAMARTGDPHSATAQFYINHADNPQLDGSAPTWGYAVFGEVLSGMDVVDRIAAIPTQSRGGAFANLPVETVVIKRVREGRGEGAAPKAALARKASPATGKAKARSTP
jgi:peptidyl-prolyl cis-trans isomerase B (cyclophilin B)